MMAPIYVQTTSYLVEQPTEFLRVHFATRKIHAIGLSYCRRLLEDFASQAVSDEVGDRCPLRYYRKGTDIGADCETLVIILGIKKLERCCRIRWSK